MPSTFCAATGLFYLAVAAAIAGDQDQARTFVGQARDLSPEHVSGWINQLAQLGQDHCDVLPLIAALTAPSGHAAAAFPQEAVDGSD